jgi:nucleoid-associated protein YgaU
MAATPIAFTATRTDSPPTENGPAMLGTTPSKLVHAFLELRDPPKDGGTTTPGPRRDQIDFQFNPKELSVSKSAKWKRDAQKGSKKSGVPEFTGAEPSKLSLEMFLDASDTLGTGVVDAVEQLFACCVPTAESLDAKKASPPWVVFHWGGLTGFPAYVSQVSVKYTLFTPGGLPVRGIATVTLEEISGSTPGQNPTSGATEVRTVHRVLAGDSLADLAWREYGDATRWRIIAAANGIDDPLRLRPGTDLLVPPLDDAAAKIG